MAWEKKMSSRDGSVSYERGNQNVVLAKVAVGKHKGRWAVVRFTNEKQTSVRYYDNYNYAQGVLSGILQDRRKPTTRSRPARRASCSIFDDILR